MAASPQAVAPRMAIEVILSVFALDLAVMRVLMISGRDPRGSARWSLPNARVGLDEPVDDAGPRGVTECSGLDLQPKTIHLVGIFGDPARNPGAREVAVAQGAVWPGPPPELSGPAEWVDPAGLEGIAGDHSAIIDAAMRWLVEGIRRGPLGLELLGEEFGIDEVDRLLGSLGGGPARARAWRERLEDEGQIVRLFGRRARFRPATTSSTRPG